MNGNPRRRIPASDTGGQDHRPFFSLPTTLPRAGS
jgi:hypothetical protein